MVETKADVLRESALLLNFILRGKTGEGILDSSKDFPVYRRQIQNLIDAVSSAM